MAQTQARPNFSNILDTPSNEVERPKPMPQGTYLGVIFGLPRQDKSSKKQTEFVEFTYRFMEAGEDVDEEALADVGGLAEKTIKDTYYLTEASLWRLKDMLNNVGAGDDDMTLRARLEETQGKTVKFVVKHEASQDGQSIFHRVDRTLAIEA